MQFGTIILITLHKEQKVSINLKNKKLSLEKNEEKKINNRRNTIKVHVHVAYCVVWLNTNMSCKQIVTMKLNLT